ncbi:unnamed protein product [Hermetia illucens]|uniref:Transcription factor CBF/NF-Y/archaeal histone domain-containing protein n=2 Tax=Hermetia illucens TaxID=343691 RepID=A0A7R8YLX6_HERIL|nr:unnamed protein product [Hermetia illucens]
MASEELFSETPVFSEELPSGNENLRHVLEEVETETEIAHSEEDPDKVKSAEQTEIPNETKSITENNSATKEKPAEKSNEPRLTHLPLTRIRNLMKLDPDLHIATLEGVFAVTKATEMFIDSLAKESFVHTNQAKKKTVQKRDVDMAIASVDSLMFLEGAMNF